MKPKTWTHPKFALLQRRLSIGPALAAGILEGVWHLAATFDPEHGRLPYTDDELAAWLGVDLAADELLAALVDGRWLDHDEQGLLVHDWDDHKPGYIRDAERKRAWRSGTRPDGPKVSRDCPVTVQDNPRAADHSDSDSDSELRRGRGKAHAAACFTPPTVAEIQEYATVEGLDIGAQTWWDHYQANGWKVGRNAMKDWKAAVRRAAREGWTLKSANGQPFDQYEADRRKRFARTKKILES